LQEVDLVEEVVPLRDRELAVLRPRDSEGLIDEDEYELDERMPYWAELWPSGVALARAVSGASLRGRRVLELGCGGLALPSIAAALAGARVLATDWAGQALSLAEANAERNGARIEVAEVAWHSPAAIVDRAPWDLVLASDVLYEFRNAEALRDLLPLLTREVWIADPGRAAAVPFLEWSEERWERRETTDPDMPSVTIYRFHR
jgi:predicted nicotinamide N-methyase